LLRSYCSLRCKMEQEKEKLQKELEFLKESFDTEVISEEEYLSGKERVEKQLKDLEVKTQKEKKSRRKEPEKEEENPEEEIIDEKNSPEKEYDEMETESEESEYAQEEKHEDEAEEIEKNEVQKTITETREERRHEKFEEKPEDEIPVTFKKNGRWKFFAIGLLVVMIAIFAVQFFSSENPDAEKALPEADINSAVKEFIACNSDKECREEGKIGICTNPGTKNAECEFKDDAKAGLVIINAKDCFNCDTSRVLKLLKELFPNLDVNNLDYDSKEGGKLAGELGIEALPAYIFDSNLSNAFNFGKAKSAFDKAGNKYIMNKEASGATYFVKRDVIPGRLDVFLADDGASLKAERNLKEFLDLFGNNIKFAKHNKNDPLAAELKINTFPTFLINNKIKFSGVQPADKIKENFCMMNKIKECSEELSKNLI